MTSTTSSEPHTMLNKSTNICTQVSKSEKKVEEVRSISENLNLATFVLKFNGYYRRPELFVMCRTKKSAEVVAKGGNEIATLSLASSVKVCESNCRRRICENERFFRSLSI